MRKLFYIVIMIAAAIGAFKLKQVGAAGILIAAAVSIDLIFSAFRKGVEKAPGLNGWQKIKNWFNT